MQVNPLVGSLRPLPEKRGKGRNHRVSPSVSDEPPQPPTPISNGVDGVDWNENGHDVAINGGLHGLGDSIISQRDAGTTSAVHTASHAEDLADLRANLQRKFTPISRGSSRKLDNPPPKAVHQRGKAGMIQPEPLRSNSKIIDLPTKEEIKSFCRRTGGEQGIYYDHRMFVMKRRYTNQGGSDGVKTAEIFNALAKRRKSDIEEPPHSTDPALTREGKVMLKVRGDLIGKGDGRVSELTEVQVNLKFDRAGKVKLADKGHDSDEPDEWRMQQVTPEPPNPHEFSVILSRVKGTSALSESEPATAADHARAANENKRTACLLTVMAQRLLNPNPTEDPAMWYSSAMRCGGQEDGRWVYFELQLELEMDLDPGSGTEKKMSEKEQRKNSSRRSASSDEGGRGAGKRGEAGKTLLERVDEAVASEVIVKYWESGKGQLPVPQEKQVRFHDMVWMESEKDTAWTVPHSTNVEGLQSTGSAASSTEEPQMEDSATQKEALENRTHFFQLPNTGWTCPPSSVVGSGTMHWKQREEKSFNYVRVSRLGGVGSMEGGGSVNPHLLRFYIERVWGLKRPKLFVSVTGAAKDFDLADAPKEKLLRACRSSGKSRGYGWRRGDVQKGSCRL